MTEIEQKALALIKPGATCEVNIENISILATALCRAIEQHEAFRQEVSDAVEQFEGRLSFSPAGYVRVFFDRFIIAKPVDPLRDAIAEVDCGLGWNDGQDYANQVRAALAARGLEITEKKP